MRIRMLVHAIALAIAGSASPRNAAAQFSPPNLPINIGPSLPDHRQLPSAPVPRIVEAPRAAQPAPQAVMARPPLAAPPLGPTYYAGQGTGGDGVTPCEDLRQKAGRLTSAGNACFDDLRNGTPRCAVVVHFYSPRIGREVSPDRALEHARRFRQVADGGDQEACREFGGEGFVGEGTLRRAVKHYGSLCSSGDEYGCRADQMTRLCFDATPTNQCVRDCLIQYDVDHCEALGSSDDRLSCRKRAHWSCYEGACGKFVVGATEFRCISRFAGWMQFMVPPTR